MVTRSPRLSIKAPMVAAERPFPKEDKTPPVTMMNFVVICERTSVIWG